jgi:DNA-binding transcriptional LysR family regulator
MKLLVEASSRTHTGSWRAPTHELSGHWHSQRIVITTTPSFAASWLVERLAGFARAHPKIEIAFEASSTVVDLRFDPVHLAAIRHGLGGYPGSYRIGNRLVRAALADGVGADHCWEAAPA